MWSVSVTAVRMLVALAGTPGMFSQDRDMYTDGSQEKMGGVGRSEPFQKKVLCSAGSWVEWRAVVRV